MAGVNDPIRIPSNILDNVRRLKPQIEDLEYEINRMRLAGIDVTERIEKLNRLKSQIEGIISVYGT